MAAEVPLRGFRLRRAGSAQKFGVAAGSLRGLLRKGCRLLQVPLAGSRLCLYEDGTELSEGFFRTLPPQTELVLLGAGESWQGCVSDVERLLATFHSQRDAIVEAAQKLLSDEQAPRRQKLLADLIHNLHENISAEDRQEDSKWFEGLESRFKNKSSYMRYSCESRIRSYMKEVNNFTSNVHPTARDAYKRIIDLMSDKLKSAKYNGCYFDRREEEAVRLCTREGWFSCQGPFDRDDCPCKHSINPYSNRESRILFSTWNLDHIIEKKRTVVPELAEAVKTRDGREVNWEYFYQLLFTIDNLKLDFQYQCIELILPDHLTEYTRTAENMLYYFDIGEGIAARILKQCNLKHQFALCETKMSCLCVKTVARKKATDMAFREGWENFKMELS